MASAASRAKRKAFAMTRYSLPAMPAPRTIAIEAPVVAAEAIPRVKGLASGFRRIPCMTDPATASPNPAKTAKSTRWRRRSQTMVVARSGALKIPGKRPARIAMYDSATV
ncbi:MAG: hypothetical protein BWX50_00810 [Euryarchaeota archaeon ADurb.Bin009]|nr:MAG: hypothetical protein BWX50_00810 [Euryarchaeota archaeon ADurb.Bin009]